MIWLVCCFFAEILFYQSHLVFGKRHSKIYTAISSHSQSTCILLSDLRELPLKVMTHPLASYSKQIWIDSFIWGTKLFNENWVQDYRISKLTVKKIFQTFLVGVYILNCCYLGDPCSNSDHSELWELKFCINLFWRSNIFLLIQDKKQRLAAILGLIIFTCITPRLYQNYCDRPEMDWENCDNLC